MVEYAIVLSLVSIVTMASVSLVGRMAANQMGKVSEGLNGGPPAPAVGFAATFGDNSLGQLGNGSALGVPGTSSIPVSLSTSTELAGKSVTAVTAGSSHACALASGAAYCWGADNAGQLGDGLTTARTSPHAVTVGVGGIPAGTVTAISAGGDNTCALIAGNAWCWGANAYGQLGHGDLTSWSTPQQVVTTASTADGLVLGTVSAIALGLTHACALAGTYDYCWGRDQYGQIGDIQNDGQTTAYANSPVTTPWPVGTTTARDHTLNLGPAVIAIATGDAHSCALQGAPGAATMYCWGTNGSGVLGRNTVPDALIHSKPITGGVSKGDRLVTNDGSAIGAGGYNACEISSGGSAYCWGANNARQIGEGDSSTTYSSTPKQVKTGLSPTALPLLGVTEVHPAGYHTCALAAGAAYCWGDVFKGALGRPSGQPSGMTDSVFAVDTSGVLAGRAIADLAAGGHYDGVSYLDFTILVYQ